MPNKELVTISHSKMSTFNTCMRKYRYVYVQKIKRAPNSALAFGIAGHKAQELIFTEQMKKNKRPKLSMQKDIFTDSLDKMIADKGVDFDKEDNRDVMQDDGLTGVEVYDPLGARIKPIALEQPFEISFSNVPWVINGYMDIVEKDGIRDLKFGRRKVDPAAPQIQTQFAIYRYAKRLQDGKNPKTLKVESIKRGDTGINAARSMSVKMYVSEKIILSHVAETARAIVQAEISGDFPKIMNGMICGWCQYRDLCGLPLKK